VKRGWAELVLSSQWIWIGLILLGFVEVGGQKAAHFREELRCFCFGRAHFQEELRFFAFADRGARRGGWQDGGRVGM
jgi:hypothetical protein